MSLLASIIITNYNYEKYVAKCIRSCIDQSLEKSKYEIIIIDDSSTDNSLDKIYEYKKSFKNFIILQNEKNLGVAKSANKAFKMAKGKYIVRVDADDYINQDFLRVLVLFLEEHKTFFSVSCDYYLVDKMERKISKLNYSENPISCSIMYDRKKLLKLGGYNSKFRHREEEELRQRIKKKNYKNFNINLPMYRYLMHKNNKTKSNDFKLKFKNKINRIHFQHKYKLFKKEENFLLKNVCVIIPARKNSKRFKNKNIRKIWGKPMLYWSILASKRSQYVKNVYVSSENDEILKISKKYGAKVIRRPSELSRDNISKMSVIRHAVENMKNKPSLVISLQANSPDIRTNDINRGLEKLIRNNLNEVISTDLDGIQNAALRVMKLETVFQKSLSTYCGFIITDTSDIHTLNDLKLLEKNKIHENK